MTPNPASELIRHFQAFLEEAKLSQVSIKNYVSDIRLFLNSLGIKSVRDLTISGIQAYLQGIENAKPEATFHRYNASLRRFVSFLAIEYRLILPWNEITGPKSEPKSPHNFLLQFRSYLLKEKKSPATIKNYLSDLNHFLTWTANSPTLTTDGVANRPLASLLTKELLTAYFDHLKLIHTSTSVSDRRASTLRKFVQFSLDQHLINHNPFATNTPTPQITFLPLAPLAKNPIKRDQTTNPIKKLYLDYHTLPFTPYLHLALLVLFASAMSIFGYAQIFKQAKTSQAYPASLVRPSRQLAFQGRLTDPTDQPITDATNVGFKLFNQADSGTEVYSAACTITPDADGVFSTQIGNGACGAEIGAEVFSENQSLFLEVAIGGEALTPRQPIATSGYALNSETLQGYPASASATANTVPVVNSDGSLVFGETAPTIVAENGHLGLKGQAVTLTTLPGTDGNINIAPDGRGSVNLIGSLDKGIFLNVTDANLTSGTLIEGYVANNSRTGTLLHLASGTKQINRLTVYTTGQTDIIADTYAKPAFSIKQTGTGAIFSALAGKTQVAQISTAGDLGLIGGLSLGSPYTTHAWPGQVKTNINSRGMAGVIINQNDTGPILTASASGTTKFVIANNGNVGINTTNPTEGKLVVVGRTWTDEFTMAKNPASGYVLTSDTGGNATWTNPTLVGGWQRNSGALAPVNLTDDVLLGATATASAKIGLINIASGTPTATIAGSTTNNALSFDGNGNIGTANKQTLTLGSTSTGNISLTTAGRIFFDDGNLTSTVPLTVADTALDASLTQGIIDAINDAWNAATGGGGGLWTGSGGVISPTVTTNDLAIGGSTSAAPFFINDSGTITFTSDTNLYRSAANTLATDDNLNIGGNLDAAGTLTSGTSNAFQVDASGNITTAGDAAVNGGDITSTGALAVTPTTTLTLNSTGDLTLDSTTDIVLDADGADVLLKDGGTTFGTFTNSAGDLSIASQGTNLTLNDNVTFAGTTTLNSLTYTWPSSQTTNYVLSTNGTGTLSWVDPNTVAASTIFWNQASGALFPKNSSVDVTIGGQSTASAKFAFTNVNSGTPTATIAGSTANAATYLTGNGLLATRNNQSLTLGASETGNVILAPGGTTALTAISANLTASGTLTLPNSNTLTGVTNYLRLSQGLSVGGADTYYFNSSGDLNANTGTFAGDVAVNGGDITSTGALAVTPTTTLTLNSTGDLTLDSTTDIVLDADGADVLLKDGGTTFGTFTNSAGDLSIASQGTNLTLNDNVTFAGTTTLNSLTYTWPTSQSSNYVLTTNGSGTLSWNSVSGLAAGDIYWIQTNGAIVPKNSTVDLLVGGQSTASAKFAFINANSGTPTATIAGSTANAATYLTGNGLLATRNNQSLTLGASETGNVIIAPGGTTALTAIGNDVTLADTVTVNGAAVTLAGDNTVIDMTGTGTLGINTATNRAITTGTGTTTLGGNLVLNNSASTTTFGGIAYTWPSSQTANYVLATNGTGTLSWSDPAVLAGAAVYWNQASGVLFPKNSSVDVTIGGQSTASAKFAFVNVNSGTPTATISGSNNNATYLTATGNLATTNMQTLTLGGASTGNISLQPQNGSGQILIGSDTNLYRGGTNTLTTDDTFNAVTALQTGGTIEALRSFASPQRFFISSANDANVPVLYVDSNGQITLNAQGSQAIRFNFDKGTGGVIFGDGAGGNAASITSTGVLTTASYATISGNLTLYAASPTIQSVLNRTLTIGGASTGDLSLDENVIVSGDLAVNGGDITSTGALAVTPTTTLTLNSTGDLTLDSTTDIVLDADGADVILKDAGTTFGTFTNSTTDLTLTIAGGNFLSASALNFGGAVAAAYNYFASDISGASTPDGVADLYVQDELEVDGTTRFNNLTYTWPSSQTADYVLSTNGTGTLSWSDPAVLAGAAVYWNQASGVLFPKNSSVDVTIGGQSTASAKFAFKNVDSGTPTASISGTSARALVLDALGNITTTAKQSLTLGDSSTGNIILNGGNVGIGTTGPTSKFQVYNGTTTGDIISVQLHTGQAATAGSIQALFGGFGTSSVVGGAGIGGVYDYSTANGTQLALYYSNTSNVVTEGLRINKTGNVGVGDTTPNAQLDIDSLSATTTLFGIGTPVTSLTTADVVDITTTYAPTAGGTQSAIDINLTNNPVTNANTLRGLDIGFTDAGSLANTIYGLYVDATTANSADTTYAAALLGGNVGVGTASPVEKLDVSGSATISGNLTLYAASPTIQSVLNRTLTLGGTSTGDISLDENVIVSGDLAVNGGDITSTGALAVTPTTTLTLNSTGDLTLDSSTDIVLDADGADVLLKDGGTTFGTFTNSAGDLSIASQGTNLTLNDNVTFAGTTTLNSLAYTWPSSQTASYVLSTNGTGTLSWIDPGTSTYWNQASGALFPKNSTVDVTIGGQSTASAKFAFTNVDSGTPTASISGTNARALYLDALGNIGTTALQSLVLGGASTGNILLQPNADTGDYFQFTSDATNLTLSTTDASNLTLDASGNLILADTTVQLSGGSSTLDVFSSSADTTLTVSNSNGTYRANLSTEGQTRMGNFTSNPTAVGEGAIIYRSDAGEKKLYFYNGTDWTQVGAGAGATWWGQANGLLYPLNSTVDVTFGGQSTASAKFAFTGVDSGTPTASMSGASGRSLVLDALGTIQTTASGPLTLGSLSTGPIQLKPQNTLGVYVDNSGNIGLGTSSLTAGYRLDVSGNATVSADLRIGGQTQLGRFSSNPTAVGRGSVIYNAGTDTLNFWNGSSWLTLSDTSSGNPWTDGGAYLYPTQYESVRVYDSGATDYVDLSHNGTNAVFTSVNTTQYTFDKWVNITGALTASGNLDIDGTANDIAGTLNLSGNTLTSPSDLTINSSGTKVIVTPDLQINGGDILGGSGNIRVTLVDALQRTDVTGLFSSDRGATFSAAIASDTPLTLNNSSGSLLYKVANSGLITSGVANGATAVAFNFDTTNNLTTNGAKLMSLANSGTEKFYVDKDGNLYASGAIIAGNGFTHLLTNKSGGAVANRALVVTDTSNNSAFTTTTTPYSKSAYGVVISVGLGVTNDANSNGSCDADDICLVALGGEVEVTTKNATSVSRGDYLFTSDTAGSAVASAKQFDGLVGAVTNTSGAASGYVKMIFKVQPQVTATAAMDKGTKHNEYRLLADDYTPVGDGTSPNDNIPPRGLVFDNFSDPTKTDWANTTVGGPIQVSAASGAPVPAAPFRAGLIGNQTMSTATTDNAGNTYLGSNTVNDTFYYDRTRDSSPEVLVELGIDPNWYNGVTLNVATTSAQFSQNSVVPGQPANPNLSPSYNGSLLKVTGNYSSGGRTIYITIKSPSTFDWTDYTGNSATGTTITPGTAQTLTGTGVSVTFSNARYNTGDVFKIASWFVEASSSTRSSKQQFPERSYIIATASSVDIIDADTQKLWMRFSQGTNYALGADANNNPSSANMLNGKLYVSTNGSSATGLYILDFVHDALFRQNATDWRLSDQPIARRDSTNTYNVINTSNILVNATVNDVSAAVIPNQPTQEVTVSGWGYINVTGGSVMYTETVNLPYKFNNIPRIQINYAGYVTSDPENLSNCVNNAQVLENYSSKSVTNNNFTATFNTTTGYVARACYTWTATGQVSPRQYVAVATNGGTSVINETNQSVINVYFDGTYKFSNYVWLTTDGTLYYENDNSGGTNNSIHVKKGVAGLISDQTGSNSHNYAYNRTNSSIPAQFAATSNNNDIYVSEGTSTISPKTAHTIYLAQDDGLVVIQEEEFKGNGQDGSAGGTASSNGSVKYYTKDYISEEMIGDIRGMWPLNGNNTASDFEDVSIKANTLTGTNITSADAVSGVRGEAYDFDGSTEYLSCTDASCGGTSKLDSGGTAWSSGVWFKCAASPNGTQAIISKWNAGTTEAGYRLYTGNTCTSIHTDIYNGTTTVTASSATGAITPGTWYHAVGTYDGTNVKIYLNGALAGSTAQTGNIKDTTEDFRIGVERNSSVLNEYFKGSIDEPFVTAEVLTTAQIKHMYEVGYRALQSHATTLGGGAADANQQLGYISTGTNTVGAVGVDYNNQFMYVGLNSTTLGGLSKIDLNSDTNIKTFNSSANVPTGGSLLIDEDVTSLAVGYNLEAAGSAASGVKTMSPDSNATATSGDYISKTVTTAESFTQVYLWTQYLTDSSDSSNTVTVWASNDGGSNYQQCNLTNTDSNQSPPEREYFCQLNTPGNQLKAKFVFARGSTKTNTYLTRYGLGWIDVNAVANSAGAGLHTNNNASVANGSYIEVAHNQGTNDLITNGWFLDVGSGTWRDVATATESGVISGSDTSLTHEETLTVTHNQGTFDILASAWEYDASASAYKRIDEPQGVNHLVSAPDSLRGWWKLEETSGNAADSSRYGNTLTANGGLTYSVQGKVDGGDAITFNGSTGYFSCTDASCGGTGKLDVGGNAFSTGAWVKTTSVANQAILSKMHPAGLNVYNLQIISGAALFQMRNTGGSAYVSVTSNTLVNDGKWHHIVGTWNPTGTVISVYVDGKLDKVSTNTTGTQNTDGTGDFEIGRYETTNYFNGTIDDVFVYAKDLTVDEIQRLYEFGAKHYKISNTSLNATTITNLSGTTQNVRLDVATAAYRIQQVNSNTVRLYNYSGSAQNLRLDVITGGLGRNAGTVSLAPAAADTQSQDNTNAIWINQTGVNGSLLKLQRGGTDILNLSQRGGDAALILDQRLSGDIFTASASGTTRLTLTNANNVDLSGIVLSAGGPKYFPIMYEGQAQTNDTFFNGFTFGKTVTITGVTISAKTAPTGSALTVDLVKNSSTQSLTSTLAAGANSQFTNITDINYGAADTFGLKITGVGSTEAGRDIVIIVHYLEASGGDQVNYISIPYEGTAVNNDTVIDGIYLDSPITVKKISVNARTAPTGANLTVDLTKGGSVQSRTATLAAGSTFETTDITDTGISPGERLGVKVTGVGSTVAGESLQIILQYTHDRGDTGTQYLPFLYYGLAQNSDDIINGFTPNEKLTVAKASLFVRAAPTGANLTVDLLKNNSVQSRTMTLHDGYTYQGNNIKDDPYTASDSLGLRLTGIGSTFAGESVITILHTANISTFASSFLSAFEGPLTIGTGDYNTLTSFVPADGSLYVSGSLGVSGVAYLEGGTAWTSADIAEAYPTLDATIEAGDLVSIATDSARPVNQTNPNDSPAYVEKTTVAYDKNILGIISTKPAGVMGMDKSASSSAEIKVPVALIGRVPVKIDPESEPIEVGDFLTSSDKPGLAMKATKAGYTVAKALENWDPANPTPTIEAFVHLGFYDPALALTDTGDLNIEMPAIATDSAKPYILKDLADNLIERIGVFSDAAVANMKAGLIVAQRLTVKTLTVEDLLLSPLADIDQLYVAQLTAQEATVSGTLTAEKLISPTLDAINTQLDDLTTSYATASAILASIKAKYSSFDAIGTATDSADPLDTGALPETNADLSLYTQEVALINDLTVNNTLLANSINSKDDTLYLQPTGLGSINLLADLMTLTPDGNVTIRGNLNVSGAILANQITSGISNVDLLAGNTATISGLLSAGKISLTDLIIAAPATESATATDSATLASNASVGIATLASSSAELFISNTNVSDKTLIYLTPVSSTSNQVLYVKSKETCLGPRPSEASCVGGFTVAVPATPAAEILFNYWLIQTQP